MIRNGRHASFVLGLLSPVRSGWSRSTWRYQPRFSNLSRREASDTGRYRPVQHTQSTQVFDHEAEIQYRVKRARRIGLYVAGGLLVFFGSMFATMTYVKGEAKAPPLLPGEDVTSRYKDIAPIFDKSVDSTEFWMGIGWLRKWLLRQAHGNVLEVSVGTGRNSKYYKEDQCSSITMIDLSGEMIEIAKESFKEAHPKYKARRFVVQSALDPITSPPGGFDTIVQTMGLCSTPDPVGLLHRMASVLKTGTGRILLLEHGRSHYDWVNEKLDESAARHADKYGCWWNKDIQQIVDDSGLEIVKLKRYHFGTTWWVELKCKAAANAVVKESKSIDRKD